MDPTEKSPSRETGDELSWTAEAEKKLVRKIDICLLPMLWVMNLLSWMDRANLGNANIAGLTQDLQLSSTQFSMAVIAFYFGYIAWAFVTNLILPRTRPSIYLPGIMLLWGVVTCGIGAAKTYPQLVVMRILVGALEAGLTPGMIFVFSCWYLPEEFGKRSSFFLTSAQIGGIFGGLTAGALMEDLEGVHGIRGWRWLFIVEGVVTIGVAIIAMFILPDYPGTCKKLTAEERDIAVQRLLRIGTLTKADSASKLGLKETMAAGFKEWKTYALGTGSAFLSGAVTLTYFYPVLVKGMGYTDPVMAQYMTAPIWAVAFVFTIAAGFIADRIPMYRGLVISSGVGLTTICGIMVCVVFNFTARYVLLAFMTAGIWVSYSQILAYIGDVMGATHPDVRAFAVGVMTMAAQAGYIFGAYVFPTENAPKHLLGFGMVAASAGLCSAVHVVTWLVWRRETRAQRKLSGA